MTERIIDNFAERSVEDLEEQLSITFEELRVDPLKKLEAFALIQPLRDRSPAHHETYKHCLRVGLLAKKVARFMHIDEKALLFAGIFHDLGKQEVPAELLDKTEGWTPEDDEVMRRHIVFGYDELKERFDFSAEIILWHHRFQKKPYPEELPVPLHNYSAGTREKIVEYGRILALVDMYDALHRENSKFGPKRKLTDMEIEWEMLSANPDRRKLVEDLYKTEIFVNSDISKETEAQKFLYEGIWSEDKHTRSARETGRHVMLATALEPIADKVGNTTRFTNESRFLKLEYFIAAGVNIGQAFEKLAYRIDSKGVQPKLIYDLALKAQKDSLKNRAGGRVNQGIIELLLPIVVSQHLYNRDFSLSVDDVLKNAIFVLKNTSQQDVNCLIQMKRFANDLCGYTDRVVAEYSDVANVFEYYKQDLESPGNPTGIAHNGEFFNVFPTVKLVYDTLVNPRFAKFSENVEDAYRKAVATHYKDVGRGFIADCIAAGIYLYLSQNPKAKLIT